MLTEEQLKLRIQDILNQMNALRLQYASLEGRLAEIHDCLLKLQQEDPGNGEVDSENQKQVTEE